MKAFSLFFSLFLSSQAFAVSLPVYPEFLEKQANAGLFPRSAVSRFRVLVFPHLGMYSVPQGRESIVKSLTITAPAGCDAYLAAMDEKQEWYKTGERLKTATRIELSISRLRSAAGNPVPIYYECAGAFTVNRAAPLKSIEYSGDFIATTDLRTVQIINLIDPETYLKGVVPAEVEPTWPIEVLKAQAIAARTYAWWSVVQGRTVSAPFDMDDTVSYQAYLGNLKRTELTDSVTDQTQNMVMVHEGQVIKAYFSADSGGYTENSFSAFGTELPYCKAKAELYDLSQFPSSWSKAYTITNFQALMAAARFIPSNVAIRKVYVEDKDLNQSGRVDRISLLGSNGRVYTVSGNDFRYRTKVRSNLFTVSFSRAGVVINGKGYGHGVGMAQIGALQYAKQFNWSYDQILQFYYTDVAITNE